MTKVKFSWPLKEKKKLDDLVATIVANSLDTLGRRFHPDLKNEGELYYRLYRERDNDDVKAQIWGDLLGLFPDCDDDFTEEVLERPIHNNQSRSSENSETRCTSVLGTYRRISSPGVIELRQGALGRFSLSLAVKLQREGFSMTLDDFFNIHAIIVAKTFFHELFHHLSDLTYRMRFTSGNSGNDPLDHFVSLEEEALAVAVSRWHIGQKVNATTLIESLLYLAYDYKLKGYKDWINFKGDITLWEGVIDYFKYEDRLLKNRDGSTNDSMHKLVQSSWNQLCNQPFAEVIIA